MSGGMLLAAEREGLSSQAWLIGVHLLGRDECGDAVAHIAEWDNAVASRGGWRPG